MDRPIFVHHARLVVPRRLVRRHRDRRERKPEEEVEADARAIVIRARGGR
jgi:hypothetical protein